MADHHPPDLLLASVTAAVKGRYEVQREIGRGGMATVYLALDARHGRRVALKVLHPEFSASVNAERFQREIQICAQLTHPNILSLHDSGESDGVLYYVMPFIDGESLRHLLEHDRELPVARAATLGREVLDALGYAHERGFVHRDVKPENILIAGGHALVSDFGIARVMGANITGALTQSGIVIGSPTYMSPEQSAADEHIDARSDLYSVGCVLFEMLVGMPPYAGNSAMKLMSRHAIDAIPSARMLRGDVPAALDAVITRAMAKNPDDRFASAHAFQLALDMAVTTTTAGAHSASPSLAIGATGDAASARTRAYAPGIGSVAVLPFADNSAAKDQEFLCEGLADELRAALAKIPALRVASRTSSMGMRGRNTSVHDVGRELGVVAVIEGTVQRSGSRLRISMSLSNATDGFQVWAERYDRETEDIFALQDEIAQSVVEALRVTLSGERRSGLVTRQTQNVEAYQLYLRGRNLWGRREQGGLQKAIECFQQSLEIDPLYVMPYIGLADAFNTFGAYEYLPPKETFPRVFAAAEHALKIDPTLAESHTALGSARAHYSWDWRGAEESLAEAIALNPQYPLAHAYFALVMCATGRHERAREAIARAQQIDPLSGILNALVGWVADFGRRHDDAIRQSRLTIEMQPDLPVARSFLGYAHLAKGENAEALEAFSAITGYRTSLGGRGMALARLGRHEEARAVLTEMDEIAKTSYVSSYGRALIHIGLGEREQALTMLEMACDEHGYTLSYIGVSSHVDPLRNEPRFHAVIERMGLSGVPGAIIPAS